MKPAAMGAPLSLRSAAAAAAGALLLLLCLPSPAAAQATLPNKCPKDAVHIIAARGHGTPSGYGGLNLTVLAIQQAVPGSTAWAVPYYTAPTPSYDFQPEVENGTVVATTNLHEFARTCPNSPIVLLGYSEGACIIMNMLCGESSYGFATPANPQPASYAPNIVATVVFGDETRTAGQAYNLGTCTVNGIFPRSNPNGCAAFEANMQSYCDAPDPLCCNGNNETTHHIYPEEYDSQVASFVSQQFSVWKTTHTPVPTSTSSTSVKTTSSKSVKTTSSSTSSTITSSSTSSTTTSSSTSSTTTSSTSTSSSITTTSISASSSASSSSTSPSSSPAPTTMVSSTSAPLVITPTTTAS